MTYAIKTGEDMQWWHKMNSFNHASVCTYHYFSRFKDMKPNENTRALWSIRFPILNKAKIGAGTRALLLPS